MSRASVLGTAATVGAVLALAVVCFAKGRVLLGIVALFIPVAGAPSESRGSGSP